MSLNLSSNLSRVIICDLWTIYLPVCNKGPLIKQILIMLLGEPVKMKPQLFLNACGRVLRPHTGSKHRFTYDRNNYLSTSAYNCLQQVMEKCLCCFWDSFLFSILCYTTQHDPDTGANRAKQSLHNIWTWAWCTDRYCDRCLCSSFYHTLVFSMQKTSINTIHFLSFSFSFRNFRI